jgi:hypothetical protein
MQSDIRIKNKKYFMISNLIILNYLTINILGIIRICLIVYKLKNKDSKFYCPSVIPGYAYYYNYFYIVYIHM